MDTQFYRFYTKEPVVEKCMVFLKLHLKWKKDPSLWVDPSANEGIFLDHFPKPRIGVEIMPSSHEDVIEKDFLDWKPFCHLGNVITVGNPPFGRATSLAVKFFNHAASFSNRVAMILPRSFQKESIMGRLHPNMHLEKELILDPNSFTYYGRNYAVPCVFQIWKKGVKKRVIIKYAKKHKDFEFVKKEEADFAIQRVGVYAGRLKLRIADLCVGSHYFLRSGDNKVIEILKGLDYSEAKAKSVGCPSLTKHEIVRLYSRALSESSNSQK